VTSVRLQAEVKKGDVVQMGLLISNSEIGMGSVKARPVEMLAQRYRLNEDERGGVLRHLIEGSDLSLWGLSNALTRTAQDCQSYDRSTEFETLGGNLLALPAPEIKALIAG
jgi:hypothetical protein